MKINSTRLYVLLKSKGFQTKIITQFYFCMLTCATCMVLVFDCVLIERDVAQR